MKTPVLRFDPDINAMNLSELEKNGLQVYRNYTKSFDEYRAKEFVKELNSQDFDITIFRKLCENICNEEIRFLPIILLRVLR